MRIIGFLIAFIVLIPLTAGAETITVKQRYLMGDNDSRADARQMAFLMGKRKILERAGTYISGNTTVSLGRLEKDEVTSIAGAILAVETADEAWVFIGETMAVELTLTAVVDRAKVDETLAAILKSSSSQKQIAAQREDLNKLERQLQQLQSELAGADTTRVGDLRKQRSATLSQISQVEARRIEIEKRISHQTAGVQQASEGMTESEVLSLLGQPVSRATTHERVIKLYYGRSVLYFENGVLACKVREIGCRQVWPNCAYYHKHTQSCLL
jgi:hypothetical protein